MVTWDMQVMVTGERGGGGLAGKAQEAGRGRQEGAASWTRVGGQPHNPLHKLRTVLYGVAALIPGDTGPMWQPRVRARVWHTIAGPGLARAGPGVRPVVRCGATSRRGGWGAVRRGAVAKGGWGVAQRGQVCGIDSNEAGHPMNQSNKHGPLTNCGDGCKTKRGLQCFS